MFGSLIPSLVKFEILMDTQDQFSPERHIEIRLLAMEESAMTCKPPHYNNP